MDLSRHRGRWTIRYRDASGRRIRKRLPESLPETLTPRDRAAILREARLALEEGGRGNGGSFAAFLDAHEGAILTRYRHAGKVLTILRRLARVLGGGAMADLTPIEAEDAVLGLGLKGSTVRVYVAYLSAAWAEAMRRGWCESNPWRSVKRPRATVASVPALTEEEMARLFSSMAPRFRSMAEFLYETGLRLGECRALVVEDVGDGRVVVRRGKNGKPRVVPLTPRAHAIARSVMPDRGIGAPRTLFGAIPSQSLRFEVHRACGRAGLPRLRVHDLRHLCAVRLVRAGANLHDVKDLLGHSSIVQTERYAGHAPDAGARRAIDALQRSASRTEPRSTGPL